jgi:hypothetical protein
MPPLPAPMMAVLAFSTSPCPGEIVKVPRPIRKRLMETLCYVA